MRKAVIDIGTNTFHLLIADVIGNEFSVLKKITIPVKLGEGGISKGEIIPAAFERGINALITFSTEINAHKTETVIATATAAVRDASNGTAFIEEAYEKSQIKITIIDGQQEALYIYEGAKAAGALTDNVSLVMDIGGGSTEFILCNQHEIFWKESYRIGAARLLADFYKSDPLNSHDLTLLENHLNNTLQALLSACNKYNPLVLVGTAGAYDSYAEMIALQNKKSNNAIVTPFNKNEFDLLIQSLIKSTHQERVNMRGLIPLRTDMILMSSIISSYILSKSSIEKIIACKYALKEGVLLS